MKRFIGVLTIIGVFTLSGCFDKVEETTINQDGSGIVANTLDMGKLFSMLAAMGGDEKMKDADKINIDSTIQMNSIKDSLKSLSDAEKKLLEKGTAHFVMNIKEEKFFVSFSIPFLKTSDIPAINEAVGKSMGKVMQGMFEKIVPEDKKGEMKAAEDNMQDMENQKGTPSISSYFGTFYEKNKITKKLDKERIAKMSEDESLKSMKEMSQMGMVMNLKTVINLPRPAKKATGKGITLSDDKKTVIIDGTLEDFFEDPSKFEYEIEY